MGFDGLWLTYIKGFDRCVSFQRESCECCAVAAMSMRDSFRDLFKTAARSLRNVTDKVNVDKNEIGSIDNRD